MKTLLTFIIIAIVVAQSQGADGVQNVNKPAVAGSSSGSSDTSKTEAKGSYLSGLAVSPYATVGFPGLDGKARTGWGIEAAIAASKTFSIVGFGETDETGGSFFDRAGLGFKATSNLGKRFHPFGALFLGYAFDEYRLDKDVNTEQWFIRPQFGFAIDIYHHNRFDVQLVPSGALDVWLDGRQTDLRLTGALRVAF